MPPKKVVKEKENVNGEQNEKPLEEHTVVELRKMLDMMQLETGGKKSVLIDRIIERYETRN
jgi:hypothetical protein